MQQLENEMTLYHGSYCVVEKPDLKKCAKYKDFGQGFYLTTSKEQAKSFAKISATKAKSKGIISNNEKFAYISCFNVIDQYCFRTEKAISKLQFIKSEKVVLE